MSEFSGIVTHRRGYQSSSARRSVKSGPDGCTAQNVKGVGLMGADDIRIRRLTDLFKQLTALQKRVDEVCRLATKEIVNARRAGQRERRSEQRKVKNDRRKVR